MVKRILFVDHAKGLGGAEGILLLLMSRLDRTKWEPHLVGVDGDMLDAAQMLNIPTYPVALPRLRRSLRFPLDWLDGVRSIATVANQINADFLHANTIRAAMYTAIAAKLVQRPFIWHMHDFWLSENKPSRLWLDSIGKRTLVAFAQHIIANSNSVAHHLPTSDKTRVIYNGIDTQQFNPKSSGVNFRQQYGIPPNVPLTGMVGRLRPWKGQVQFLQMAKQISENMTDAYFAIVGGSVFDVDNNYLQQLQLISRNLGIENRVVFTGQLKDVRPALASFDVFVHPGDPEPFGLVNIEAMAMGKPVVAFAHGALPEIVIPDETGLLVPPNNIPELATAVSTLLNDKQLAQRLGAAGYIRASQQFDIARTVKEFEAMLIKE